MTTNAGILDTDNSMCTSSTDTLTSGECHSYSVDDGENWHHVVVAKVISNVATSSIDSPSHATTSFASLVMSASNKNAPNWYNTNLFSK
mmetsp:Transcript_30976/g.47839  ORF Transcript_30976/g.47839 Transcript_30976/m.47839 type:complete len:89 (+) Transcript_30976:2594-2860(+)